MFFVEKGYCRYCGKKCRFFKVENSIGKCRKKPWCEMVNEKTGKRKNISSDKNVNIKSPWWCPKKKH